jgi:hypothetical protein
MTRFQPWQATAFSKKKNKARASPSTFHPTTHPTTYTLPRNTTPLHLHMLQRTSCSWKTKKKCSQHLLAIA